MKNYQPKGGMCAACKNAHKDCSNLKFNKMPKMSETIDTVIVRCTEFKGVKK